LLPTDVVVADKFDANADSKVCSLKYVCWSVEFHLNCPM
jgi:hypothetical protein